jgi:hypothetical protein
MQQKDVEVLWRDFLLQDFCLLTHITLLPVTHITGPTSKDERPETSQTVSLPPPVDGIEGVRFPWISPIRNPFELRGLFSRSYFGPMATPLVG